MKNLPFHSSSVSFHGVPTDSTFSTAVRLATIKVNKITAKSNKQIQNK